MASIQKTDRGYRAQVAVFGQRESATFRTRREADAWASARETELRFKVKQGPSEQHTLRELLVRYRDEVSVTKRGERWELIRINRFLTEYPDLVGKRLADLTPDDFGVWRLCCTNQSEGAIPLTPDGFMARARYEAFRAG